MASFDLQTCARPNILALQPYRCARDDYKDNGTNILLDANENAFGPGLTLDAVGRLGDSDKHVVNGLGAPSVETLTVQSDIDLRGLHRYPDPHQEHLKSLLCELRTSSSSTSSTRNGRPGLTAANLFLGVGSDEAIDALIRCFCTPGSSRILNCPPTYGMYSVSAAVNDIEVVNVPLLLPSFQPDVSKILATLSADLSIKLIYLCSPGNPTGTIITPETVSAILAHPTWNGLVVVDEAYIDFAPPGASLAESVLDHPNLVVMQTLSKAFGLAGIRLGAAFASPPVAGLLNSLKAPYNISAPTAALATAALASHNLSLTQDRVAALCTQRDRLVAALPNIPGVGAIRGGLNANFLLVEFLDSPNPNLNRNSNGTPLAVKTPQQQQPRPSNEVALAVYQQLAERRGVVVRFRGKEYGCEGCLRITVGTPEEVDRLLEELKGVLMGIYDERRRIRKDEDIQSPNGDSKRKRSNLAAAEEEEEEERQEKFASEVVT
ncbi:MAG: hypothetical protein M1825_002517 [Sarcosagium campestre]|nr:MAG: hypothetical protein M1825_002517 [Sarcosagium campestre]